jgi:putative endonuclease
MGDRIFSVYVLKSLTSDRTYIGSTANLEARIAHHNSPRARWTKRFQPWVLVYHEEFETRGEAVRRERYLKSQKGALEYLESAGVTQLVESQPSKLLVAGSSPVSRSRQK